MARRVLLDTGFLVALVNRSDPDHARCADLWRPLRVQLVSVEGVLVEAAHLLRRARGGPGRAVELCLAAEVRFVPSTGLMLKRAVELMEKYRNVPMDFVDALLMCAAEDHDVREVLTLDRRGFATYRTGRDRRLAMLPVTAVR